ncbi:MAG: DUF4382 domain-containing protein [Gemmatimonadales bacterium]
MPYHRHHGVALMLAGLVVFGCSDSGSPPDVEGLTSVQITDTPFPYDVVEHANLFIVQVEAGTDSGSGGSGCTNATVVATPNRTIDLLALQGGTTATLGETKLSAGDYRAVCITINTDLSSLVLRDGRILTGTSSPVIDWSGSGTRIIKADIFDSIPVTDSGGTILIHFDVGKSFIPLQDVFPPRTDSGYAFIAVTEALYPPHAGSISGTVVGTASGGTPIPHSSIRAMVGDSAMAENTWFVAGTGTTDTTGHFKIAYLAPSSRWAPQGWVYNLVVDAPSTTSFLPVTTKGVTVVAPTETPLGEIVLP